MSQLHVITFTGPVGVGKSTQIRLWATKLTSKGLRVKVTFLKTNHFPAFVLVTLLVKILIRKRNEISPMRALIDDKPTIFRRLFKLWLILDIWGIFLRFLLTVYLPIKMGYLVIVEEYVPAVIADYIYLSRLTQISGNTISLAMNLIIRLKDLSGPMRVVFMDANVNTLKSRWSCRGSIDEKADYLHMQRTSLLSISKMVSSYKGLLYINTNSQTIEETHRLIANLLNYN